MNAPETQRPLVVRFGAFGDMILLLPALRILAGRYGAPCEVVGSGAWTEPLLRRDPAVARCFLLTSRRAPFGISQSQRRLVRWLRQRPAGPVYVFESDEKSHWLLRRGGVLPEWICSFRDHPRRPGEHVMAHGIRLARETPNALLHWAGTAVDSSPTPDVHPVVTQSDRADCRDWLVRRGLAGGPLVLLQPGNKKTMRWGYRRRRGNVDYWPEENWARVILGLRQALPESRVMLCGAPSERTLARDIVDHLGGRRDGVAIATDDLPVPRLLALLERAHSMISVNTGPAHAAAAMGCPLVVMFGRHPARAVASYAPPAASAPMRILLPDAGAADGRIAGIPPERVLAAWSCLLPAGVRPAN